MHGSSARYYYTTAGCHQFLTFTAGLYGLEFMVPWTHQVQWAVLAMKAHYENTIFMKVRFFSLNFKTGQTISLNFSNRAFYLLERFRRRFCYSE